MPPSTMPRSTMRSDPAAVSGPRGPSRPGPHPTAARPRHPPTTPTRTGGTCRRARRRSLRVLDAPDLAAGLHREDLADPRVAGGDLLQLLEPLDVGLQGLAPGAGAAAGDGVGRRGQHRLDGALLDLAVVGLDRVDHLGRLLQAPRQLRAELRVGALDLVRERLADVVQEPAPL